VDFKYQRTFFLTDRKISYLNYKAFYANSAVTLVVTADQTPKKWNTIALLPLYGPVYH